MLAALGSHLKIADFRTSAVAYSYIYGRSIFSLLLSYLGNLTLKL